MGGSRWRTTSRLRANLAGACTFSHTMAASTTSIAPPGLWRLHRQCALDIDALQEAGIAIEAGGQHQEITLLASVPLTGEPWRALAEGEIVAIKDGRDYSSAG